MNIRTRLTAAAAAAGATLLIAPSAAHAFTTDDAYDTTYDNTRVYAAVDYLGANSVDVAAYAKDKPGDAYCTSVAAEVWANDGYGYRKLGNTIPVGSVCGGGASWLPTKRISTAAGSIWEVRIVTTKGSTGQLAVTTGFCRAHSDGYENCR